MSPWVFEVGICVGLVMMAFALFGSHRAWLRRAGNALLVGASALAMWFWTKNLWMAALGAAVWLILPIGQAVWLSRRLRFSAKRKLEVGAIDTEEFFEVADLTGELRKLDFKWEGDYWLKPATLDQGYRLFTRERDGAYAAAALVRFGNAALVYLMFVTPANDNTVWLTWDYPLAYGLRMPPHLMIHRCLDAATARELDEQHAQFLALNNAQPQTENRKNVVEFFEDFFASLIHHNLHEGVLQSSGEQEHEINYTWRGTAFVLWQVLRDVMLG